MYQENAFCRLPKDSAVIWRYLDFAKYVDLLDTRTLFFARSDRLGDPLEGSLSEASLERRRRRIESWSLSDDEKLEYGCKLSATYRNTRLRTYISCWTVGEHENAAMWHIYSSMKSGVAIRSTCQRLRDSLSPDDPTPVNIGEVLYEGDKELDPGAFFLLPYLLKRPSFAYERELRAIIQAGGLSEEEDSREKAPPGKNMKVDLKSLVESAYVAPMAPEWFFSLVESVTKRYRLSVPVVRSSLSDDPLF